MHSRTALATLLLLSAVDGYTQSLGAVQGAAIIGRPLDIVVQSRVPQGSDAQALCVQAEVSYGETRLSPSDVSVSAEGSGEQGRLRVRTRVPVNEPFVTVELRLGCPSRLTRSYTLLADVAPTTPLAPSAAAEAGRVEPAPRLAATEVAPRSMPPAEPAGMTVAETPIRSLAPTARPAGVMRLASKVPVVRPADTPTPREVAGSATPRMPDPPAAPSGPRLKLEPVDLGQGGSVADQPEPSAGAGPVLSDKPAADASPVDPAALQQELASLRAEQQRLLMAVESLNRELTAARQEHQPPLWPYALAGAALAVLGGLAWWRRRRPLPAAVPSTMPWWATASRAAPSERVPTTDAPLHAAQAPTTPAPDVPKAAGSATTSPKTPVAASAAVTGERADSAVVGLEVNEAGASVFQDVPVTPLDLAALHDLWNRVEFFESLGQIGDAVAALRTFVHVHPRACEAPYLRWWHLAQRHDRDPRSAQAMYEQHYQRLLPASSQEGPGLEADEALLAALQRDWPTEAARQLIETALASQPGDPAAPLRIRTLTAFDDLIVLHGVLDLLPLIAPAAPLATGATSLSGVPSMLDFELPDVVPRPVGSEAAVPAATAPDKRDDAGLDFHLSDWLPPAPPSKPPV